MKPARSYRIYLEDMLLATEKALLHPFVPRVTRLANRDYL